MSLILIQVLQCPHGTSESLLIREKTEEGYPPYAESTCAMRNRSMMPTDEQSWNYNRSHETECSREQEAVPRLLLLTITSGHQWTQRHLNLATPVVFVKQ